MSGANSARRTSSMIRTAPAIATRSLTRRDQNSCHGERPATRSPVSGAVSRCSSASTDDWPIRPVRLLCLGRAGGFYARPFQPANGSTPGVRDWRTGRIAPSGSIIAPDRLRGVPVFSKEIEIRWRDLDGYAHVNHAVYVTYLEEARDEWLTRTLADRTAGWDHFLVHLEIDYRRQLIQADDVVVASCE